MLMYRIYISIYWVVCIYYKNYGYGFLSESEYDRGSLK